MAAVAAEPLPAATDIGCWFFGLPPTVRGAIETWIAPVLNAEIAVKIARVLGRHTREEVRPWHPVESVSFYRDRLGFAVEKHNPGKFAALRSDDLHLFLNAPGAGSAGKAGGNLEPGGWSRFMIVTKNLDGKINELRNEGASFRGEVADAGAGRQILLEDPSGNVVELFEYADRSS